MANPEHLAILRGKASTSGTSGGFGIQTLNRSSRKPSFAVQNFPARTLRVPS